MPLLHRQAGTTSASGGISSSDGAGADLSNSEDHIAAEAAAIAEGGVPVARRAGSDDAEFAADTSRFPC